MRLSTGAGLLLILLGIVVLYLLRDALERLVLFVLEFLGIAFGFFLIILGIGIVFGGWWMRRGSWRRVVET